MLPLTVFAAHAAGDAPFARELGAFLDAGCDNVSFANDAVIGSGEDLMGAADRGLAADVLVLLISPASNPARWLRERWEPLLFEQAAQFNTRVAVVLLGECGFPQLLRRKLKFFDATGDRHTALRGVKRWVISALRSVESGENFSADLDGLYRTLADQTGSCAASGPMAERFAEEAGGDFDAVFWIPSHGRSLTQIAGELGAQLGMRLDGPLERNCPRIRETLARRRCLVVLDAPQVPVDALLPQGRTSVLFTTEPVRSAPDSPTLAGARGRVAAGRFAEAYEALYQLRDAGVDRESCARELVWICEQWDRLEEANALRFETRSSGGDQLRLF